MNYRHAFHAGNFADVFKHAFLVRLLLYLGRKHAPYRVIDTHAGEGAYDLAREEAARTGEWRDGVARLRSLPAGPAADLLAPYLEIVGPCDGQGRPKLYPGSPAIAQRLTRADDKLIFCETHPSAFAALEARFARDRRVKTLALDGWTALGAFTPPVERRGLVLIDPPFEARDEFSTMKARLAQALRKWETGIFALWHPVKAPAEVGAFWRALCEMKPKSLLRLELAVAAADQSGLTRTGLIIVNPPYVLAQEAQTILPALARCLEISPGAGAWTAQSFGD